MLLIALSAGLGRLLSSLSRVLTIPFVSLSLSLSIAAFRGGIFSPLLLLPRMSSVVVVACCWLLYLFNSLHLSFSCCMCMDKWCPFSVESVHWHQEPPLTSDSPSNHRNGRSLYHLPTHSLGLFTSQCSLSS